MWPKFFMPLATVFVEIFQNGKYWGGFRSIPVTHWKEFQISVKKRTVLFHLSKTARNVQSGIISKNAWNVQGVVSFQRTLGMFRMVPYHASKSKIYIMN